MPVRPRPPVTGALLALVAVVTVVGGIGLALPPAASEAASPAPSAALDSRGPSGPATAGAEPSAERSPVVPAGVGPAASPTGSPATVVLPIAPYQPRGPSATAATRTALQAELARLAKKHRLPGASVAILFPDGSTWTGQAGFADVAAKEPVTATTGFALASISKTFTAVEVLALADAGDLDLSTPVHDVLPALVPDERITVAMLLDHTSGLHDFYFDPKIDRQLQAEPAATWTAEQSLAHVGKPYFEPGLGWHYSNTNYLLLGLVAEAVAGRSLAAELRDRFFEPLGLPTLSYQGVETPRTELAHGYRVPAKGAPADLSDGTAVVPFTSVVTASGGAGSIVGSALDVARWARAVYGGGVLSAETLAQMTLDARVNAGRKNGVPYGLGVQVYPVLGQTTLGHSGRFLGFQSVVRYFPETGLTVAVLTNQSRIDPAIVLRALVPIAVPAMPPCSICPTRD